MMKDITMRSAALLLGLLGLLDMQAWAQTPQKHPISLHREGNNAPLAKVSTHEDYPQWCLQFTWDDTDSVWDTVSQSTYTYLINGNVVEEVRSTYSAGTFTPDIRSVYSYYPSGLLQAFHELEWDGNTWDSTFISTKEYDAYGNTTLTWAYAWNGGWDTTAGYMTDYTYHNISQVASTVDRLWQSGTGWLLQDSTDYHYTAQHEWDTISYFTYTGIGWTPEERVVGLTWHDFSKEQSLTGRQQSYNTGWQDYVRYNVTYGLYDSQTWKYETYHAPNWDSTHKEVFVNDYNGHQLAYEYYGWSSGWQQQAGERNDYDYDGNNHTVQRIREYFDGFVYENDRKFLYANFFASIAAATDEQMAVTAYPNPAADRLHFQLALPRAGAVQIALYDLQGRLRAQTLVAHAQEEVVFPISEMLENGTYIYRIHTKQGLATGKVVVQR